MEYCKITFDEVFYSDLTDAQLLALIKLKTLAAHLETVPLAGVLKKHIHHKQLKTLQELLKDRSITMQEAVKDTLRDVQGVVKKRGREKLRFNQSLGSSVFLPADCQQNIVTDEIRLNEIKLDERRGDEMKSAKAQIPISPFSLFYDNWKALYKELRAETYKETPKDKARVIRLLQTAQHEELTAKAKVMAKACKDCVGWPFKNGTREFTIPNLIKYWDDLKVVKVAAPKPIYYCSVCDAVVPDKNMGCRSCIDKINVEYEYPPKPFTPKDKKKYDALMLTVKNTAKEGGEAYKEKEEIATMRKINENYLAQCEHDLYNLRLKAYRANPEKYKIILK